MYQFTGSRMGNGTWSTALGKGQLMFDPECVYITLLNSHCGGSDNQWSHLF